MISLWKLHRKYIWKSPVDASVKFKNISLGVYDGIYGRKVGFQISTYTLKHIYDKRTAEEYDSCLIVLKSILTKPDTIYKNKGGKTGDFCLVKSSQRGKYFIPIQVNGLSCTVITIFRIRKESYLNGYEVVYSREGDILHRNYLSEAPQ